MRYDLMNILEVEDTIEIYDLFEVEWGNLEYPRGAIKYKMLKRDTYKTWYPSFEEFGVVDYDDFLMLTNGIPDPMDMIGETELYVPVYEDLRAFLKLYD